MYTDLYLKFTNEAQANSLLYSDIPSAFDAEGNPTEFTKQANFMNIDVLGVLYEGGEWDEEGNVVTEPTQLEGWHVNIRVLPNEDATALEEFAVVPTIPRRVWA